VQRLLAITALGRLPGNGGPIRRSDGRPGDLLVSTGPHGLSRLGLALLQTGQGREPADNAATAEASGLTGLDPALRRRAIRAHQRPVPRFDAVQALIRCRPDGLAWRAGGCDSSDGLAAAAAAIAAASGCAAQLERRRLPLDPAMTPLPEAERWCLGGGEDFELVLALEPDWAEALLTALPGCSAIGTLTAGTAGSLGWSDGSAWPAPTRAGEGFQHFRGG
jgi:thiamine-monophosphate kinase